MAKGKGKTATVEAANKKSFDAQISELEREVGADGIKAANRIVEGHKAEVVKLAYRYIRRDERQSGGTVGLGKRMEDLLSKLDPKRAAEMRSELLAAKKS